MPAMCEWPAEQRPTPFTRRDRNFGQHVGQDRQGISQPRSTYVVDTQRHISSMPKGRSSSRANVPASDVVIAERPPASDAKGSINLRVEAHTRQLIDDAAAILGKTRTEFMVESARRQAIDVLVDQRLFVLDPRRYDAFMHALDNPPAPGPKLRSLLRRVPAWRK